MCVFRASRPKKNPIEMLITHFTSMLNDITLINSLLVACQRFFSFHVFNKVLTVGHAAIYDANEVLCFLFGDLGFPQVLHVSARIAHGNKLEQLEVISSGW